MLAVISLTASPVIIPQIYAAPFQARGFPGHMPTAFVLSLSYLLTGLGVAFTNNRQLERSSERIRKASRLMYPPEPDRAATILLVYLCVISIFFIVLSSAQAPENTLKGGSRTGLDWIGPIMLPALYSICLAAFATMARAVHGALKLK